MGQRKVRITDVPDEPGYAWTNLRWLRRQVYEGGLRSYRVAGRVLIDLDDLDALVLAGQRNPAPVR